MTPGTQPSSVNKSRENRDPSGHPPDQASLHIYTPRTPPKHRSVTHPNNRPKPSNIKELPGGFESACLSPTLQTSSLILRCGVGGRWRFLRPAAREHESGNGQGQSRQKIWNFPNIFDTHRRRPLVARRETTTRQGNTLRGSGKQAKRGTVAMPTACDPPAAVRARLSTRLLGSHTLRSPKP